MRIITRIALLAALTILPSGCLVAAAGAGAAGAIAYNDRGAQALVNGSVADVAADARAVFSEMGITVEETNNSSDEMVVAGSRGEMRVRVQIERESATTSEVMVTAREGTLDYDREMARDILSRINARS